LQILTNFLNVELLTACIEHEYFRNSVIVNQNEQQADGLSPCAGRRGRVPSNGASRLRSRRRSQGRHRRKVGLLLKRPLCLLKVAPMFSIIFSSPYVEQLFFLAPMFTYYF
jgi:hypothetical protein